MFKVVKMIYAVIVYFNWVLFFLLSLKTKNKNLIFISIIIGIFQLSAFLLHIYLDHELAGKPDQLYSWIPSAVIVVFTLPLIGFLIFRFFRYLREV